MREKYRVVVILLGVLALCVGTPHVAEVRADRGERLSEQEMKRKMRGWARELGVKCSYCHVKQGREYDYKADTDHKTIAHYCEEHFVELLQTKDGREISCGTCHQKRTHFLPRPEGEQEEHHAGDEGEEEGGESGEE